MIDWDLVPVSEAKVRFHELVNRVGSRPVLLLRRSRPEAVLLSYAEWTHLRREVADLKDRLAILRGKDSPRDMRLTTGKLLSELGLPAEDE